MTLVSQLTLACIVLTTTASYFPNVGWWDNDDHAATDTGDGGSHLVGDTLNILYTGALELTTASVDTTVDTDLMNVGQRLVYRITGYHDVTISFVNGLNGQTIEQTITINSGHTIGYLRQQLYFPGVIRGFNRQWWLPGFDNFYNMLHGGTLLQPAVVIEDLVGSATTVTFSVNQVAAATFTDNAQITVSLVDAYHQNAIEAHYEEILPFLSSPTYSPIVQPNGLLYNTIVQPTWTWADAQVAHRYTERLRRILRQHGFTNRAPRGGPTEVYFRVPGYTTYLRDTSVMGSLATEVSAGVYTITLEVVVPQLNVLSHADTGMYQQIARYVQDVHGQASSSAAQVCSVTESTVNMMMRLYREGLRRRVLQQDEHDVEAIKELEAKVVETLITQEPLAGEEEKRRKLQTVVDVCHDGAYCSYYQAYIPQYCWYFTSGEGHENSYCTMFGEAYCCHQSCGECHDSEDHATVEIPNAEHYCESGDRQTNQALCEDSSCCHWNTWEAGDASFNGEGRCWSSYGDLPVDQCSHHTHHVEWHDQEAKGLVAADTGYQCHYDWYYGTIRCAYEPSPNYWSRLTLIHVGGLDQTNLYTIRCPDNSFAGVGWWGFVYCGYSDTFTTSGPGPEASRVFSIERVGQKEYAIRSVGTGNYCVDSYFGLICRSEYDANHARARYHMFDWWHAISEAISIEEETDAGRRELKEEQDLLTVPDESRRNLFGLAKYCTVVDRSYEWCIGEHKSIKFADGTQIKYGGFKEQCYSLDQPFEWWCGDERRSDVHISGTGWNSGVEGQFGADTIFVFYGDQDCTWTERNFGLIDSSKCKGRVTFTALMCDQTVVSAYGDRRQMEEGEPHYSMTDEEREAFLDNSRGFVREDDGFLVLEEDFHQLHENWEGEIPLKMQRQ